MMLKITIVPFFFIICLSISAQEVSFFNADGAFSIGTASNRTASINLCDLDQDGDLDALVANGRHWAEQNYIFYNEGLGLFRKARRIGPFLDASYVVKGADLNQDGFVDLVVANDKIAHMIYFGSATGAYDDGVAFGALSPTRNMELGDVDSDGDIDIVFSNRKHQNEIYLNDGKGIFEQVILFGGDEDQTIQTKIIDINGDGHMDLITAERNTENKIYLNNGTQEFFKTVLFGRPKDMTRSIDVGDMNGDGHLDIVSANLRAANKIHYGSIKGTFDEEMSFDSIRASSSLKIADLDQDGHLDVVFGNYDDRNYVYLGTGNGTYREIGLREDLKNDTYDIAIGDINGDGLPDIIESNSGDWNLFYRTFKN